MRWDEFRESQNVEDGRGSFPGGVRGVGGLGLGTVAILGLIGWGLGIDPGVLIGGAEVLTGGAPSYQNSETTGSGQPDELRHFVAAVLGDTEDRWGEIFKRSGRTYQPPKLRLFSQVDRSACGMAKAAMGPFYCPEDQRVYLDASFFD